MKARFRLYGSLDRRTAGATVTIDRGANLFSVRILRQRREYTLPLQEVASMVWGRIVKAEAAEKLRAKQERAKQRRLGLAAPKGGRP